MTHRWCVGELNDDQYHFDHGSAHRNERQGHDQNEPNLLVGGHSEVPQDAHREEHEGQVGDGKDDYKVSKLVERTDGGYLRWRVNEV